MFHGSFCSYGVEIFWNCLVLYRVLAEARLRIFGYLLAKKIVADSAKANFSQLQREIKNRKSIG